MAFSERGGALIELQKDLEKSHVRYVLVGGYAISAFNPRFSTDLDIVASIEEEENITEFLENNGFELQREHKKDWFYDREVKEYKKSLGSGFPVGFDLLVNGLGCRQTDAEWSFEYLYEHSSKREVKAGVNSTTARVLDPEVLIAVKLHSGRETDIRDVTALVKDSKMEDVTEHLHRGEEKSLKRQLEDAIHILGQDELKHGYRSDFGESSVPINSIRELRDYIYEQLERLKKECS